ncbi:MAG: STAS domain-containing protein [Phycisphaeraceae bacterium]|nr:STAS domain-containing protein [Phycisphaeraceae bacterium]
MQIDEQRQGAVTVVKPIGALVGADAEQFKKHVAEVVGRSLGRFVVDASAVPFLDSRGLEVLVEVSADLAESGQTLRLCGEGETLRETLELTETARYFEHYQDVQTAVRSFL